MAVGSKDSRRKLLADSYAVMPRRDELEMDESQLS